ncbi:MAG TPA: helix-turn-helix domain-containing protein [bacterium]|nr:helix-turn-helix domain-containing protein [bacterium]
MNKRLEMTPHRIEKPLTVEELCDYLQASKSTIDQYNREGMPRFFVGKECRYISSKVIEWLERRSQHRVIPLEETFDPRKELLR